MRGTAAIGMVLVTMHLAAVPAFCDPFERLNSEFPGAELWWEFPDSESFSCSPEREIRLGWGIGNIIRYKEESGQSYLLHSDGFDLGFHYADPGSYLDLRWIGHGMEVGVNTDEEENRLDGSRDDISISGGFNIHLDDSNSLIIAGRYLSLRDDLNGTLPSLVNGIPGLDAGNSSWLDWHESDWEFSVSYQNEQSSIGIIYGQTNTQAELGSVSDEEEVRLAASPNGYVTGIFLRAPLDEDTVGRMYYLESRNFGTDGIFRRDNNLGPLRLGTDSRRYGFQLTPSDSSQDWKFTIGRGIYRTSLEGSADISGFGGPVFGIVTPRVHLDSFVKLTLTSVMFERDTGRLAGSDVTIFTGVTRWDIEDSVKTWESYLFGGGILNESETGIELESGWLAHLGFEACWSVDDSDSIILFVRQSIPISVSEEDEIGEPGPPSVETAVWDGGRWISLNYIFEF